MNNAVKSLEEQHPAAHEASFLPLVPSLVPVVFARPPSPLLLLSLNALKIPGSVAL